MARGPATASSVAVAAGSVTAVLAVASSQGWLSGAAVELLLAIGVVVVAVCAGWLVLQAVIVALLHAATSVVAPARPFGLERILRLMELQALEREASAGAGREREPRVSFEASRARPAPFQERGPELGVSSDLAFPE